MLLKSNLRANVCKLGTIRKNGFYLNKNFQSKITKYLYREGRNKHC